MIRLTKSLLLTLALSVAPVAASPYILHIRDREDMMSALAKARGGDKFLLAPGDYGHLVLDAQKLGISPWTEPVIFESANPNDPAIFSSLSMNGIINVSFNSITVNYVCTPGDPPERPLVTVVNVDGVSFNKVTFQGDTGCGGEPDNTGYGSGTGARVIKSHNIAIRDSSFTRLMRAATFSGVTNLVMARNRVSDIRADGFDFVEVNNVLIESNIFRNFRRPAVGRDHPDMIQFWTKGTSKPSANIVIRNNILNCGAGGCVKGNDTQTIFMRNEEAELDNTSQRMFYRNIRVEGNVIRNAHTHGITVGETNDLVIRNNTLIQAHAVDEQGNVTIPSINISPRSNSVIVQNNITSGLSRTITTPREGWTVRNNRIVQWTAKAGIPGVSQVFVNPKSADPDLFDLAMRSEIIAAFSGAGSSLLYPGAQVKPMSAPVQPK